MESEKVKEIKKALDFHKDGLPYIENCCVNIVSCKDILTLINELERENELLRNAKVVYENVDYCYEGLKKAEKRIAELEKVYDRQVRIINELNIEVVKEQKKLPKFAERLKKEVVDRVKFYDACIDITYNGLTKKNIDEVLKEFVGVEE